MYTKEKVLYVHVLLKLDKKGKLLKRVKIKGNGPGELQTIYFIETTKNRLFLQSKFKVSIYNTSLNHINDIKLKRSGESGKILAIDTLLYIKYQFNFSDSYLKYDLNGTILSIGKNPTKIKKSVNFNSSSSVRVYSSGKNLLFKKDPFNRPYCYRHTINSNYW